MTENIWNARSTIIWSTRNRTSRHDIGIIPEWTKLGEINQRKLIDIPIKQKPTYRQQSFERLLSNNRWTRTDSDACQVIKLRTTTNCATSFCIAHSSSKRSRKFSFFQRFAGHENRHEPWLNSVKAAMSRESRQTARMSLNFDSQVTSLRNNDIESEKALMTFLKQAFALWNKFWLGCKHALIRECSTERWEVRHSSMFAAVR